MSCGAKRCTCGSETFASRSEKSCAEVSRLRRSWLILDTASPSAARWLFSASSAARLLCMAASSRSAVPISSARAEAAMMREGFSGSARNATMFAVMRRIGRTRMRCSAR